ncbi:CAP domain-containing protein [Coniella lustricola]|uniref:CAP domain-containing protein n=1 Tax=Coniella lustricola TaxID=2025994 RepID=A0A2T3ALX0_9PEZI|nr:CAP domain-containing protein [Coniella lustricola]
MRPILTLIGFISLAASTTVAVTVTETLPPVVVTQTMPPSIITVSTTAPPLIPSGASQYRNTSVFTSAVLNSTNVFRGEYGAGSLAWNQTLADFAVGYLGSMGSLSPSNGTECNFSHSGGPYGENMALGCNDVTGCVDLWAAEVNVYKYDHPGFSEQTGHFTQLVWKDTTTVGCGSRLCGTRGWFLLCEYWPRGNIAGEFRAQVGRQVNGSSWVNDTMSPMRRAWITRHRPQRTGTLPQRPGLAYLAGS